MAKDHPDLRHRLAVALMSTRGPNGTIRYCVDVWPLRVELTRKSASYRKTVGRMWRDLARDADRLEGKS